MAGRKRVGRAQEAPERTRVSRKSSACVGALSTPRVLEGGIADRLRIRASVLRALGNPTRLFLVEQLAHEELCVYDLAERVGIDVSNVSKHLSLLKAAGILQSERRGIRVFYRLKTPCALDFVEQVANPVP